ncbi:uroporphyrinogen-III synthase [Ideonella paludis]|uniref:uroporphyrinogen-III synthase n=1 Tax=Ideonella paludis TaxID=1233411 RepID=UPI002872DB74|nr:uroporphyrinogen-III synthase [Ideonella paludis]
MKHRLALITRPQPQATQWVGKLAALGLHAVALPLLEIAPAPQPEMVRAAAAQWVAGDLVMFVSPNAAAQCMACLGGNWPWPSGVQAAATGPGTVAVLKAAGVPAECIVAPDADAAQFDSEHLWLKLQAQGWQGRRAWVVRGDGGRDWLAQTLQSAGAEVQFVQAYSRGRPQWSPAQLAVLAQAVAKPEAHVWLLSSSEALDHLLALAPEVAWSRSVALASHPRIAQRARDLGFGRVDEIQPTPEAVAQWFHHASVAP